MRQHVARITYQLVQQAVFERCELDRLAAHGHFLVLEMNDHVACDNIRQCLYGRLNFCAPKGTLDVGYQSCMPDRLLQVFVGAELETAHLVHLLVASGEQDHRDLRHEANFFEYLEAAHARHADVKQHDVRVGVEERLETGLTVGGLQHINFL